MGKVVAVGTVVLAVRTTVAVGRTIVVVGRTVAAAVDRRLHVTAASKGRPVVGGAGRTVGTVVAVCCELENLRLTEMKRTTDLMKRYKSDEKQASIVIK